MDFDLPKTRIYLLRHAEVERAQPLRYHSQEDVPLSQEGIQHYHQLIKRFEDIQIDACYTSDLSRCAVGANILANHFHFQVHEDKSLREINLGHWQGLTHDEVKKRYYHEWQSRNQDLIDYRVLNGESLKDASNRVIPFIKKITEKNIGKQLLLIGHGGINRIILLNAMGTPLDRLENIEQSYCGLSIIDYYINSSPHQNWNLGYGKSPGLSINGTAIVKLLNG